MASVYLIRWLLLPTVLASSMPLFPGALSSWDDVDMSSTVYGVVAVLLGFVFLFFGIRLFRTILALAGFAACAILAYVLLTNIGDFVGFGVHRSWIVLGVCAAAGVAGGLLALWLWTAALVALGALGGFGLSLFVLSMHAFSASFLPFFMTALVVLGGLLAVLLERKIIVVATAMSGAVAVSSGIDVFAKTGFNNALEQLVRNHAVADGEPRMYWMLVACGGAAVVGMVVQFLTTRVKGHK